MGKKLSKRSLELHNFQATPDVIRCSKLGGWDGRGMYHPKERSETRKMFQLENPKEEASWNMHAQMRDLNPSDSGLVSAAGFCKHTNQNEAENFFEQVRDYQFRKYGPGVWSNLQVIRIQSSRGLFYGRFCVNR